jgi:hypothetical protein
MRKGGGRVKGSKFELQIAKEIAKRFGFNYGTDIRRTPNSGALITRSDLWINPKVRHKFPYFCEMKKRENWNLEGAFYNEKWEPYLWFSEAESKLQVDPEYDPSSPVILIFARNGIKPLVMFNSDISIYGDKTLMAVEDRLYIDYGKQIQIISWEKFLENITKL